MMTLPDAPIRPPRRLPRRPPGATLRAGGLTMPRWARAYVRWVDGLNRRIGRVAMYLLFAMMGILLWSIVSKAAFTPSLWTLEMAQFTLVAYWMFGGPYSLQMGSHVRMDLAYGSWSARRRAWFDAITIFALVFYLALFLYGGISSTAYALGYFGQEPFAFFAGLAWTAVTEGPQAAADGLGTLERSYSIWRPLMWPIKALMCLAAVLMLLQAVSLFLRDVAEIRGEEI